MTSPCPRQDQSLSESTLPLFLSVSLFSLVCKYVCPVRETINYQKIDRSGLTRNLKVQFQNLCSLMVFFSKGVSAEQGRPIYGNALMRPFGATNLRKC